MKKREIWVVIVLSLVTLGIYQLYWLYQTYKELNAKQEVTAKIPTFWLLFAPFLALVAVMLLQSVVRFALGGAGGDGDSSPVTSVINVVSVLTGIVALLAIIPLTVYWMYKYCKAVETVTKGRISFGFAFGLWIVLALVSFSFVWPGLIQEGFNKVDDTSPTPSPTSTSTSTPPLPPPAA